MNSNLIITLFQSSPLYDRLALITHELMKKYAKKINADFQIVEGLGNHTHLMYRKLDFNNFLSDYDRVLYIDTDVIIRSNADNIFDEVPYESLGMYDESFPCMNPCFPKYIHEYNKYLKLSDLPTYDINKWDGRYFNAGVMVFSKHHLNCGIFDQPIIELTQEHLFREQSYFNMRIQQCNVVMHDLTLKWNGMGSGLCPNIQESDRLKSHFIHVIGAHVDKMTFLEKIRKDTGDF